MKLILVSSIILCGSLSASVACEVTSWRFGGDRGMRVRAGEACDVAFGTGIGSSAGATRNVGITVVRRPAHGRAGVAGLSNIAYLAALDFVGRDAFQVEIFRELNGQQLVLHGTVNVEIYR